MEDRPRSDRVKPTTPHADWQRNGPRKSEVETDLFVGGGVGLGVRIGLGSGDRRWHARHCELRFAVAPNNERNEGPKGSERKREKKRKKNKNENKRERILVTALITR